MDELLTLHEVAGYLKVSPKTVRRLVRRGFPCVRIGRSVTFSTQAVARWVAARSEGAQGYRSGYGTWSGRLAVQAGTSARRLAVEPRGWRLVSTTRKRAEGPES